jgi:hypothetical protein
MEYSKFTHAVITYVTPCFFPNSGNFFLILANLRDLDRLDASMDAGPTKKCPRCRKEKPLDATEFKRTRDGFATVCLKCLDQIIQKAAQTKKEKARGNKENPAVSTDDEELEDELTLRNIYNLSEIDIESFLDTISAD